MNYEMRDCIDAGTEYCPCHLAETGDCILCSQLSGKTFCDCVNWKGVCIYQEYIWNGCKAKQERKTYSSEILQKKVIDNRLIILTILAPHKLVFDLSHPGSFIFIRNSRSSEFYDTPISIMDTDTEENWIKIAIEIKGIKTKDIAALDEGDKILLRGPYWNGVIGLKNIYKSKEGVCILISRGIGEAPMIPVLKKLYANGNRVICIIDKGPFKNLLAKELLQTCNADIIECGTLDKGELSDEFKNIINNIMEQEKISLIHCSGPDILIYKILSYIGDSTNFSCCNNIKMCCGEGICGACSVRYKNHRVKKLCKFQTEPKYIFEERRLI